MCDAAHMTSRPTVAQLVATGEPLPLPGVFDALSAVLAVRAGFRAVFV
jgi:2-methylisocitrate lyase-like PEP mutase family enzyme